MIEKIGLALSLPLVATIGTLGVPLIIIFKISSSFYKDKKVSLFLYFLGTLAGFVWGGVVGVWFTPCRSLNLIAFLVPFFIGSFLPVMCELPKTTFIKVLFGVLVAVFVFSPGISLFFPVISREESPIHQAREKVTKKNLNKIRLAIDNYYEENKAYPSKLNEEVSFWVLLPRKIDHPDSNRIIYVATNPNQEIQPDQITDEGGWIYSPNSGNIRINCSHKDSIGVPYYEW